MPSNFLNVLADQLPVNWRSQVPSALFLQDQQSLLERVALRIPAGIRRQISPRCANGWS